MDIEALILRRCYPVPVTFADLHKAYSVYLESHGKDIRAEMRRASRRAARAEARQARYDRTPPAAYGQFSKAVAETISLLRVDWTAALKEATGALDEVYAIVDGREVRVAKIEQGSLPATWRWFSGDARILPSKVSDLLSKADRAGYWERPHEVRLDLQERAISHDEVARAGLVGQAYVEGRVRS